MIEANTYIQDENQEQAQALAGLQSRMWTALPGIVRSFDATAMTCEIQPAIQGKRRDEDGEITLVNLPVLLDCPVFFPHAGGCSLTFPIKAGDEVLVVFSCRAIDLWWQSGGVQPPVEVRMHDLSDGFCLPGVYSQPNVIPSVSTDAVQLRSDDGQAFVEITPSSHDIAIKTPSDINVECTDISIQCEKMSVTCTETEISASAEFTVNAPQINLNGAISGGGSGNANASFSGDVIASGISLVSHVHGGTEPGNGTTGAPQ
jgi:phage baseplate assembly protein V